MLVVLSHQYKTFLSNEICVQSETFEAAATSIRMHAVDFNSLTNLADPLCESVSSFIGKIGYTLRKFHNLIPHKAKFTIAGCFIMHPRRLLRSGTRKLAVVGSYELYS